jgi:hypothetical protein
LLVVPLAAAYSRDDARLPPGGGSHLQVINVGNRVVGLNELGQPEPFMRTLKDEIDAANKKAVDMIIAAEATLVDMMPATNAIRGFRADLVTHAGPPI